MKRSLEKLIICSLKILKTTTNKKLEPDQKGLRIQRLNAERQSELAAIDFQKITDAANFARVASIDYLNKLARTKLRRDL